MSLKYKDGPEKILLERITSEYFVSLIIRIGDPDLILFHAKMLEALDEVISRGVKN